MLEAPQLEQLERWMLAVVSDTGGVAGGLQRQATDDLESIVLPSDELDATSRLAVYAHAYFARLVEILQKDFPTVRHLVGGDAFWDLGVRYLNLHKPSSYRLNNLGEHLARFLAEQCNDDEVTHRPFAIDVARVEWAMEEVFDAPHEEPIDVDTLLAIPAEDYAGKRFRVVPALQLLELDHPVNPFITAARHDDHMDVPAPAPTRVAVYRTEWQVYRSDLQPAQAELLSALRRGETLGDALMGLGEFEGVLDSLEGWFREWAGDGFFSHVE